MRNDSTCAWKIACVYRAPLGEPVLPLVKRIAAVSSAESKAIGGADVGDCRIASPPARRTSSSVLTPLPNPPPPPGATKIVCRTLISPPAEDSPRDKRLGYPDKNLGLGFTAALSQIAQPNPRIDQDGHDAGLEQSKDEREKVEARPHHDHGSNSAADPDGLEPLRNSIAIKIELAIGQMRVANAADPISATGHDHGHRVRLTHAIRLRWMAIFVCSSVEEV